jgi:hypothetical protein
MLRGWLSVLGLLVLVVGLAAWVYWIERPSEPKSSPLIAGFASEAVQHIVIERQTDRMEFERQGDSWRMIQPFNAPADAYHIQQLLALPTQNSSNRYAVAELDLARFGLNPPKVTVRLGTAELQFGDQNPLNFKRYLKTDGVIHLIDDSLFYSLTAPATTWIEAKLLPNGNLKGLELPGWRIFTKETGGWASEPELSSAEIEQLIDTWRTARAIEVRPYPAEPPSGSLRVRVLLDSGTLEFVVLQQEPELILLRPEQKLSYHFYGAIGQRLLTPKPKAQTDAGTAGSRDDPPGP